jgi:hypothetical protein
MKRFKELFQSLGGLLPQAIFRAELTPITSAVPLSVLSNKPERKCTNAQFQYYRTSAIVYKPCIPPLLLSACSVVTARKKKRKKKKRKVCSRR